MQSCRLAVVARVIVLKLLCGPITDEAGPHVSETESLLLCDTCLSAEKQKLDRIEKTEKTRPCPLSPLEVRTVERRWRTVEKLSCQRPTTRYTAETRSVDDSALGAWSSASITMYTYDMSARSTYRSARSSNTLRCRALTKYFRY